MKTYDNIKFGFFMTLILFVILFLFITKLTEFNIITFLLLMQVFAVSLFNSVFYLLLRAEYMDKEA